MPGMLYGFPFDEELFNYNWRNEPDPVGNAILDSGAVQANAEIAAQVSQGSHIYTVPFYRVIGGTPVNYDGKTDISATETGGGSQTGVVYGRAAAWTARDFVIDHNSGADPMSQVVSQVASFWNKDRTGRLIKIAEAVFASTAGDYAARWKEHVTDISAADDTVAAANKVGATTLGDAAVKACGDQADRQFGLAIMHSVVANNLRNIDLLEFRKYTDANGIQRQLPIADVLGMTVVVDDRVPATDGKYTTYLFGNGFFQYAPAPVNHASEFHRDPAKNGGQDTLYTRIRETLLPNGFTWLTKASDGPSPTDDELADPTRYQAIFDPKCIGAAKVVSNG